MVIYHLNIIWINILINFGFCHKDFDFYTIKKKHCEKYDEMLFGSSRKWSRKLPVWSWVNYKDSWRKGALNFLLQSVCVFLCNKSLEIILMETCEFSPDHKKEIDIKWSKWFWKKSLNWSTFKLKITVLILDFQFNKWESSRSNH